MLAGGTQALCRHVNHPSERVMQTCLLTLRNLSDAAIMMDNMDDILYNCMKLLDSSNALVVSSCAGVLANLTANNPKNKVQLIAA